MKIIDIGICINNNDPKAIGRIRYRPYGMLVSDAANAIAYEEWDKNDPFMVLPFLPAHINIIPQVQQSVKIIKYDTDKDTHNIEYISGPYASPHDLQNETFVSQHRDTTYGGVIIKNIKNIRNKDGKFNSPVKAGTIIKPSDVGFRGNYGSDIIFTENGLQMRGGFLISKENGDKTSLLDYPHLAKKMGRFTLKKFPKTKKQISETIDSSTLSVNKLKYIIEYEIDSLSTPTQLSVYVYKVLGGYGTEFNTNVFGETSTFSTTDSTKVKLINTGNTLSEPTYIKYLDEHTISASYIELRELLHLVDLNGLTVLDSTYSSEDVHPFYYRPTPSFKLLKGTNTENINKQLFLSKIQVRNKIGGSGLIYSIGNADPPLIPSKKTTTTLREIKNAGEQSFSSLSSDKIYLLSTSPNVGVNVKTVKFGELDEYELTQEDYLEKIESNTYGTVRGENLYAFLVAVKNLLDSHIHNINEPLVQTDPNWIKLNALMETLRNDLLNDSIRVN